MRKLVLLLVVAVALSGCTAFENDSEVQNKGVRLDTSLTNSDILLDGSTHLQVTLTNRNPYPLKNVDVRVVNTNGLSLSREVGVGNQSFRCSMDVAESVGVPSTEQCVWTLEPGQDFDEKFGGRDSVSLPLTVLVSYTSRATFPDQSLKAQFRAPDDIGRGERQEQTLRRDNDDISVEAGHSSPVSSDKGAVPLEVSVSNTGSGNLQSLDSDNRREVKVFYAGSLTDLDIDSSNTSCLDSGQSYRTLQFLEGSRRTSTECQFVLSAAADELVDRSFSVKPVVEYRYSRSRNHQLTVHSR